MRKKIAGVLVMASLFSPLAVATPALALGITVGNAAVSRAVVDTYSNFTIIDTNNPVSASGWLTTFAYWAANTNSFEFVLVDGGNVVQWISPTIIPPATGLQTYSASVPVTAGWNLGVHFDSTGTIPFDYIGTAPAIWTPNGFGMPTIGVALTVESGTSFRVYSWNGNGTDVSGCATITLVSSTDTQFKNLTTADPLGSSADGSFMLGTPGTAVPTAPDGFPGAWGAAASDPDVAGAIWVNNNATAPSNPAGVGDGQDGTVDAWRLFSQTFDLPTGAIVSSAVLHLAADNSVQAFLDNTLVGSAASFTTVEDVALSVTSGAHELEFVVKNDAYGGATNPTGLLYKAVIDYCAPTTPPVTECPAAPSIAAAYLKEHGIKSGSTTYKNVISLVAHEMGPQTIFQGVNACSDDYAAKVKTFVDGNRTVTK